jgi:DNA-binding HxlR family transcriptional regulator
MAGKRSYDDPCGLARALDVVGERWALLVVRELLYGPKRFTDLRLGLPTASQNVLSHRLRELEEAGVVRRRRLGPPASAWAYELTEPGRELEPAVVQLARWGSRAPISSNAELSADALVLALRTTFDPAAAGDLRASYELRLGDDRFRAEVADGRIELARGAAHEPDAVIQATVTGLRSALFGGVRPAEARRRGDLAVEGHEEAAARFFTLFARPVPLSSAPRPTSGGTGRARTTPRRPGPSTSAPGARTGRP